MQRLIQYRIIDSIRCESERKLPIMIPVPLPVPHSHVAGRQAHDLHLDSSFRLVSGRTAPGRGQAKSVERVHVRRGRDQTRRGRDEPGVQL